MYSSDGYKYWLTFKTKAASYYRCSRYLTSKCPGRCLSEDGKFRTTTQHNHPAEPDRAILDRFRKVLTSRASAEKTELYSIYCDAATVHSDAAMLYPFSSAESAMRKARRRKLPQSPSTTSEIVHILETSDLFRVKSGSSKDRMYQKTINLEDSTVIVLMHRRTFDLFVRIEEVHFDGSIEFFSEQNYSLLSMHAVNGQITAPLIHALFTAKTANAYASLFAYIREDLNIIPSIIICDFDQPLQLALSYTFPEAIIKGCWFHYTDAVLCQMNSLGLQKETTKGVGGSFLRMLLVLPLLPAEYMTPGLDSLRKWMKEKNIFSNSLENLCNYVEHGWFRVVGTEKMSIFGMARSTSNTVKAFNRELTCMIREQGSNYSVWNILELLTQLTTKTYVKIYKKTKSMGPLTPEQPKNNYKSSQTSKKQRKCDLVTDTIIASATQLWIKTPVHLRNPLQFLQLSSHCINDTNCLSKLSDKKKTISSNNLNWFRPNQGLLPSVATSHPYAESIHPTQFTSCIMDSALCTTACFSNNIQTVCAPTTGISSQNGLQNRFQNIGATTMRCCSDPPPLAFFAKRRRQHSSEPPPLVPIRSKHLQKK